MYQPPSEVSSRIFERGFTIVELVITVLILGILLTVAVGSGLGFQSRAQDAERSSDVDVIVQSLERYYRTQATGTGATYPPSSLSATALAALISDPDATIAPRQTSNSIAIAASSATQTPTISQYIYQPLNLDASLCTATPCVRYKVYYRIEETNVVVVKSSLRQQ